MRWIVLPLLLLFVLLASMANAETVSLKWDPSDSEDVAGYKIYYKARASELPLDGTAAAEGPSPVDVGNVAAASLTLPDGPRWYLRATAYDSTGYESSLSNLAASKLLPPQNLQVTVSINIEINQ